MPVVISEDGHASSELGCSHKRHKRIYHLGFKDFRPFLTGFSCFLGSVVVGVVVVGAGVVAGAG